VGSAHPTGTTLKTHSIVGDLKVSGLLYKHIYRIYKNLDGGHCPPYKAFDLYIVTDCLTAEA
jgi:hypothetical protein